VRLHVVYSTALHQKWAMLPLHERNARFRAMYAHPTMGIEEVLAERKVQIKGYFDWLYDIE